MSEARDDSDHALRDDATIVHIKDSVNSRRNLRRLLTAGILLLLPVIAFAAGWASTLSWNVPVYSYRIVARYQHDPNAFTQGLAFHGKQLWEGTGEYGRSEIRRLDLSTGRVAQSTSLPHRYFGEGITIIDDDLIQLTWKSRTGFIYDINTQKVKRSFRFSGQGWGLTYDGTHLIMSDGSATLRFLDPQTFKTVKRITVRDRQRAISQLNELEYIKGKIWANIWYKEIIAIIDPEDGTISGWVDLRGLKPASIRNNREAVANGIAYDPADNRIIVTGKNWPELYEIELIEQNGSR